MVKIGIKIPTERRVKIIIMGIIVEEGNFFILDKNSNTLNQMHLSRNIKYIPFLSIIREGFNEYNYLIKNNINIF